MSGFAFSKVVESIEPALSIEVNQMVYDLRRQGQDVTTLSLGEAFFDIPMFDFRRLDVAKGYHYSDTQGLPELRAKIAEYYDDRYGATIDSSSQILVTAGSKIAIYMTLLATLDPGDEVVIHEPAWLSYEEQAALVGASVRFLPYDLPVEAFGEHLGDKTRVVIICNPNNPAGRVYTADELQALVVACRERGAYLLVDEAYSDFVQDQLFTTVANVAPGLEGVIIVNSLSKNMGMSGWRIGYAMGSPDLIERVLKLNQHLITCAPTILQQYLVAYFDDILEITLPQVQATVEKRRRVGVMLDDLGLERLGGEATFYFFVSIGAYEGTSTSLALDLLREDGVAVVPGIAYGASTERFVRVSIGTESEERIAEAMVLLRKRISGHRAAS